MADRVHPFPGFNPDNVLGESDEAGSPPDAHDEVEAASPPAKPASGLPKLLLIGAALVIAVGTVYMSIRPLLGHGPTGSVATPRMSMNQVPAQSLPMATTTPNQSVMTPGVSPAVPAATPMATSSTQGAMTLPGGNPGTAPTSSLTGIAPTTTPETAAAPTAASSAQVAAMASQLGQLQANVATLTTTVQELQAHASAHQAPAAAKRRVAENRTKPTTVRRDRTAEVRHEPRREHPAVHAPELAKGGPVLKAVVAGRAWFQTAAGTTVTVAPGGTVPVYGRVVSIDADADEVHFANGDVVR